MMTLPIIYIAGPYRAKTKEAVDLNIAVARRIGIAAIKRGWMPLIPHSNTGNMEHLVERPDSFWLEGTMELMLRCDAVLLCPGWMESLGTIAEIDKAKKEGIPVYYSEIELRHGADFIRHGAK